MGPEGGQGGCLLCTPQPSAASNPTALDAVVVPLGSKQHRHPQSILGLPVNADVDGHIGLPERC